MRYGDKGSSIATALLLGALAVTLAFTLAGISFTHLNISNRLSNCLYARNLAEASLNDAIARILYSEGGYGNTGTPDEKTIQVYFEGAPEGAEGLLTFDSGKAAALEIAVSTHNLENKEAAIPGYGRDVPPECIHLVGTGRCNGVVERIEVMLAIPTYKHAIAATGKFTSTTGGMEVEGVESPEDLADGIITEEESRPGHIAANGVDDDAVWLKGTGGSVRITGDVRTRGRVKIEGDVTVLGSLLEQADPADIPRIDPGGYDPGNSALPVGAAPGDLEVTGALRNNGPLMNVDELKLSGGYLFVDGDLVISQGIVGEGIVIATGDITLLGEGALEADKAVALVAGGNLTIDGDGKDASYFEGIVYSGGERLDIKEATVLGALIGSGEQTNVKAEDARIVHADTEVLQFEWFYEASWGAGTYGFNTRINPDLWLPREGEIRAEYARRPGIADEGPAWAPADRPPWANWFNQSTERFEYVVYTLDDPYEETAGWNPPIIHEATPPAGETRPAIYYKNDVGWVARYDFDGDGDPEEPPLLQFTAGGAEISRTRARDLYTQGIADDIAAGREPAPYPFETQERLGFLNDSPHPANGFLVDCFRLADIIAQNDDSIQEGFIRFDPNRFLQFAKKTRIVMWRPLQ
ncbi:MAG: hypothetical protein HY319_26605 [Armatimonadetes bacterium]|nr:hypothetical protein [Armatimonadota bacterium]